MSSRLIWPRGREDTMSITLQSARGIPTAGALRVCGLKGGQTRSGAADASRGRLLARLKRAAHKMAAAHEQRLRGGWLHEVLNG